MNFLDLELELDEILRLHKEWLEDNTKGKRANLSGADLYRGQLEYISNIRTIMEVK